VENEKEKDSGFEEGRPLSSLGKRFFHVLRRGEGEGRGHLIERDEKG